MADIVQDFAPSANGVSGEERGTGSTPQTIGRETSRAPSSPLFEEFGQDDEIFTEILVMVLVNEPKLWARRGDIPLPQLIGDRPQSTRGLTKERLAAGMPKGGFDLLRNDYRKEMRRWEHFAGEVVFENDYEMKEAAIDSMIGAIERALATTPGPDVETMDVVTLITEGVTLALDLVLSKLGIKADFVSSGISALAGILVNHVTEAMALKDQRLRQERLEKFLRNDRRFFSTWIHEIYRIDRIDDYYTMWIENVHNDQILDFRIPIAPEYHTRQQWQRAFGQAFLHTRRKGATVARITPASLHFWLEERGMRVQDHQDLKRILIGSTIRVPIVSHHRFPEAALRPRRAVRPDDFAFVSLFPQGTDSNHHPEGILVIHEQSSAAFIYRFDDGLYHDPA